MNDRDRLIELITNADTYDSYECKLCTKKDTSCIRCGAEKLTDYLLANGVIVQKQGEWVSAPIKEKGYDSKTIPTCTNCGYQSFITYTYCPDCGAKLKESDNDG